MDIRFSPNPEAREIDAIVGILGAAAEAARPRSDYRTFGFLIENPQTGAIEGGLTGYALYEWMFVQYLAVSPVLRRKGVGKALMEKAEAFGREHGYGGMWLETFSFQAPDFYEKLGFTVFGTIDNHPAGASRIFFKKQFA